MRELTQTSLHPAGNCWQYCVACILDIDPDVMPPQSEYDKVSTDENGKTVYGPSYSMALRAYLRVHHNLAYVELWYPPEMLPMIQVATDEPHFMTGRTVRSAAQNDCRHVVVACRGETIWDPHPSRTGLTDDIRWAFLVPFPKSWLGVNEKPCECPACKAEGVAT